MEGPPGPQAGPFVGIRRSGVDDTLPTGQVDGGVRIGPGGCRHQAGSGSPHPFMASVTRLGPPCLGRLGRGGAPLGRDGYGRPWLGPRGVTLGPSMDLRGRSRPTALHLATFGTGVEAASEWTVGLVVPTHADPPQGVRPRGQAGPSRSGRGSPGSLPCLLLSRWCWVSSRRPGRPLLRARLRCTIPYTDAVPFVASDFWWMYPAIAVALLFVMLSACIRVVGRPDRDHIALLSVAFATLAAAMLVLGLRRPARGRRAQHGEGRDHRPDADLDVQPARRLRRSRGRRLRSHGSRIRLRCGDNPR